MLRRGFFLDPQQELMTPGTLIFIHQRPRLDQMAAKKSISKSTVR